MRIRRELGAVLAGIFTTVLVTAAVELGRRSGLLQRQPPWGSTDRLLTVAGTTTATREQLANPQLHFQWL
jgi:hypothetical protein